MFAMAAPIPLCSDVAAADLRQQARRTRDANHARRLLALAEIYDGGSRTDAARIGGVTLQIVRSEGRVLRFNAKGPDGLRDRKALGPKPKLNEDQRRALAVLVDSGPIPAIHGVVRWRLKDLAQWVWEEYRVSLSETTLSRELKALGFRKLSARPRHYAQNELEMDAFKKPSLPSWRRSGRVCWTAPT
jgi:transposase